MIMDSLDVILLIFFNDAATTEIYTLSLHDALPIWLASRLLRPRPAYWLLYPVTFYLDRKSTRLNSSHSQISYAVFCFKKKKHIVFWTHKPAIYENYSVSMLASTH